MNQQQENHLINHLNSLDSTTLRNLKSHADNADDNNQSHDVVRNWLIGIGLTALPGGIWKAVKIISRH